MFYGIFLLLMLGAIVLINTWEDYRYECAMCALDMEDDS